MTRFEVQALGGAGVQVSLVSERTGVRMRSVQWVSGEEPIEDPGAVDRQRGERRGLPSAVCRYDDEVSVTARRDGVPTPPVGDARCVATPVSLTPLPPPPSMPFRCTLP